MWWVVGGFFYFETSTGNQGNLSCSELLESDGKLPRNLMYILVVGDSTEAVVVLHSRHSVLGTTWNFKKFDKPFRLQDPIGSTLLSAPFQVECDWLTAENNLWNPWRTPQKTSPKSVLHETGIDWASVVVVNGMWSSPHMFASLLGNNDAAAIIWHVYRQWLAIIQF